MSTGEPPADPPPDAVRERVEQAVDEVAGEVVESAREAADDADGAAERAAASAGSAQDAARTAQEEAERAAAAVPADDPLLDETARRIVAQADEQNPFGRPGGPIARRSPFRIGLTAALGVAVAYGLVEALVHVRSVLVLLLVSGFLAIGLDPAVQWLERRGLPRGRAVGVVLLVVLLAFVGFGFAVVPPILEQGQQFVAAVPDYLRELQDNRRVADLDRRYGVLDQLQTALGDPGRVTGTVFGGVLGLGKVVLGFFFSAFAVLILTLYFLANLPSIKDSAYLLLPRSRRARVGLLVDEILTRVGGYVAGALSIATIAGGTTFVLLVLLDVPYPVALALLVALFDLVPLVGATLGATVVTLVALTVSVRVGVATGVFFLAYQQLENYVLYPRVMQRSVDVSPAATVVAVLIGGSLLGVVGALLAIPLAAALQLVVREVVVPRQDSL